MESFVVRVIVSEKRFGQMLHEHDENNAVVMLSYVYVGLNWALVSKLLDTLIGVLSIRNTHLSANLKG